MGLIFSVPHERGILPYSIKSSEYYLLFFSLCFYASCKCSHGVNLKIVPNTRCNSHSCRDLMWFTEKNLLPRIFYALSNIRILIVSMLSPCILSKNFLTVRCHMGFSCYTLARYSIYLIAQKISRSISFFFINISCSANFLRFPIIGQFLRALGN